MTFPGSPTSGALGSKNAPDALIDVKESERYAVPVAVTLTSPPRPGPTVALEMVLPLVTLKSLTVTVTSPPRPVFVLELTTAPSTVRDGADTVTLPPSP